MQFHSVDYFTEHLSSYCRSLFAVQTRSVGCSYKCTSFSISTVLRGLFPRLKLTKWTKGGKTPLKGSELHVYRYSMLQYCLKCLSVYESTVTIMLIFCHYHIEHCRLKILAQITLCGQHKPEYKIVVLERI